MRVSYTLLFLDMRDDLTRLEVAYCTSKLADFRSYLETNHPTSERQADNLTDGFRGKKKKISRHEYPQQN